MIKPLAPTPESAAGKTPTLLSIYMQLLLDSRTTLASLQEWLHKNPAALTDINVFHYTIMAKRADVLSLLISLDPNTNNGSALVNGENEIGQTSLHLAAPHPESWAVLQTLVLHNAKQLANHMGHTPLHLAILATNGAAVKQLIMQPGANTADTPDGISLLSLTLKSVTLKEDAHAIIGTLLDSYTASQIPDLNIAEVRAIAEDTNYPSELRQQALLYCVAKANKACLIALRPLINTELKDKHGNTPVLIACRAGRLDVLSWLLDTGGLSINTKNNKGAGAVLCAAGRGQLALLRELVKPVAQGGFGLSINTKNNYGADAMFYAVTNGQLALLRELVKPVPQGGYGLSISMQDKYGSNAVFYVVGRGQLAMLRELVKPVSQGGFGLSINMKDSNDADAVLYAVGCGQLAMLRELVKLVAQGGFGLSINTKNNNGTDAVLYAVWNGQLAMLRELVKLVAQGGYGLSINMKDNNGADGVLYAVGGGQLALLRELVKPVSQGGFGLSINTKNSNGADAVLLAVANGQFAMLRDLLKPVSEGGFGCVIAEQEIAKLLNNAVERKQQECYFVICQAYFNQLLAQSSTTAVSSWLTQLLHNCPFPKAELQQSLLPRCLEALQRYLEAHQLADAQALAELIETLSSGTANFYLANYYLEHRNFISAFEYFNACRSDNDCSVTIKHRAGLALAEMIFVGDVVLSADGSLNNVATRGKETLANNEHMTLADMLVKPELAAQSRLRAIQAYEYLSDIRTPKDANSEQEKTAPKEVQDASLLRARFDRILSGQGNVQTGHVNTYWAPAVVKQFYHYYQQQNKSHLFNEPTYCASLQRTLEVAEMQVHSLESIEPGQSNSIVNSGVQEVAQKINSTSAYPNSNGPGFFNAATEVKPASCDSKIDLTAP